jgi:glutamate-1-semialdehyde 2,1-aminomutase
MRYREDRPADVCLARGTFNAHPYVMGAMNEFLSRLETPELLLFYEGQDEIWNKRAERLNCLLGEAGLPVKVINLSSIWTVCYTRPSRYNWMLQYYLHAEGVALSWVGTGRLIFSLNYSDADFTAVCDRFLLAARTMEQDGWWWTGHASTNTSIRRQVMREILAQLLDTMRQSVRRKLLAQSAGNLVTRPPLRNQTARRAEGRSAPDSTA